MNNKYHGRIGQVFSHIFDSIELARAELSKKRERSQQLVDFNKLRAKATKPKPLDPTEIFRRLPKPPGVNDLYTSQTAILQGWFERRSERDVVLKLHTGGGKTLVGLLIAQSTLNETGEPVLYLTPTNQLVQQTLEKATELGISAVPYQSGQPLNDAFRNGQAVMVGNYHALFNGKSKFGVRGITPPQQVSAVILDDAHAAFGVVRDAFTLEVSRGDNHARYEGLVDDQCQKLAIPPGP